MSSKDGTENSAQITPRIHSENWKMESFKNARFLEMSELKYHYFGNKSIISGRSKKSEWLTLGQRPIFHPEIDVWKMWILWKMRLWKCQKMKFWKCEFCKKWDFQNVNFVKSEIS